MKSRDWFVVGVRLFGVWMLIQCLSEVALAVELHFGMVTVRTTTEMAYWFHAGVDVFFGLVMLIYAKFCAGLFDWHFSLPHECEKCGYDLRATPEKCPECGSVPAKEV